MALVTDFLTSVLEVLSMVPVIAMPISLDILREWINNPKEGQ